MGRINKMGGRIAGGRREEMWEEDTGSKEGEGENVAGENRSNCGEVEERRDG